MSSSNFDPSKLSEAERRDITQYLNSEQQKSEIQLQIHSISEMCFKKCITTSIRSGALDKYEEPCMQNCVSRFMDTNRWVLQNLESMRNS